MWFYTDLRNTTTAAFAPEARKIRYVAGASGPERLDRGGPVRHDRVLALGRADAHRHPRRDLRPDAQPHAHDHRRRRARRGRRRPRRRLATSPRSGRCSTTTASSAWTPRRRTTGSPAPLTADAAGARGADRRRLRRAADPRPRQTQGQARHPNGDRRVRAHRRPHRPRQQPVMSMRTRRIIDAIFARLRQRGRLHHARRDGGDDRRSWASARPRSPWPRNDFGGNNYNSKTKQAVAAAEAGIADYLYHLNQDNAYWAKCTNVETPNAVNQKGAITQRRRNVPGTTGTDYALELLPANGQPRVQRVQRRRHHDRQRLGHLPDPLDGPGARPTAAPGTPRASSRPPSSAAASSTTSTSPTSRPATPPGTSATPFGLPNRTPKGDTGPHKDLVQWASENCDTYWKDGRDNLLFDGEIEFDGELVRLAEEVQPDPVRAGRRDQRPAAHQRRPVRVRQPDVRAHQLGQDRGVGPDRRHARLAPSVQRGQPQLRGHVQPDGAQADPAALEHQARAGRATPTTSSSGKTTIELTGTTMQVTNVARGLSNTHDGAARRTV